MCVVNFIMDALTSVDVVTMWLVLNIRTITTKLSSLCPVCVKYRFCKFTDHIFIAAVAEDDYFPVFGFIQFLCNTYMAPLRNYDSSLCCTPSEH